VLGERQKQVLLEIYDSFRKEAAALAPAVPADPAPAPTGPPVEAVAPPVARTPRTRTPGTRTPGTRTPSTPRTTKAARGTAPATPTEPQEAQA
jgi:hypothetical protein